MLYILHTYVSYALAFLVICFALSCYPVCLSYLCLLLWLFVRPPPGNLAPDDRHRACRPPCFSIAVRVQKCGFSSWKPESHCFFFVLFRPPDRFIHAPAPPRYEPRVVYPHLVSSCLASSHQCFFYLISSSPIFSYVPFSFGHSPQLAAL